MTKQKESRLLLQRCERLERELAQERRVLDWLGDPMSCSLQQYQELLMHTTNPQEFRAMAQRMMVAPG
jgi:hypothetical protein